jgi:hypothetical protein
VLFQNLAETRATGGMPGAFAVVRASGGRVRLIGTGTASGDLRVFNPPMARLGPAALQLYTDRPAIFPADVNLGPDFPAAARLVREMYRLRTGRVVDGVVATDPVALAYLLGATGPVPVPGGPALTRDNAVRTLLSDVYARFPDPAAQDRYFARATRAIFAALVRGGGLAPALAVAALARAAGERRLLVWSARPAEQRSLAGTVLAGTVPADDPAHPTVGAFLNDGSGAKIGYYLARSALLTTETCRPGQRAQLRLRLTLRSSAPRSGLPRTVTGLALSGDPYTARVQVLVFSPEDGAVVRAWTGGVATPIGSGFEGRRAVGVVMVDVPAGTTRTVDVTLLTAGGPGRVGAGRLLLSPGPTPWRTDTRTAPACTP